MASLFTEIIGNAARIEIMQIPISNQQMFRWPILIEQPRLRLVFG
jgi:hypothetical protein